MKVPKLKTAALAAAVCTAAMAFGTAHAQWKPDHTVTIVVPFAPGGPNDVVARYAGNELNKIWAQSVVIENRPGAGGVVGAAYTAGKAPDGYTMMISTNVLTFPIFTKDLPLNPAEDLVPITIVAGAPNVLVGSTKLGAHSLKELVALSKTRRIVLNVVPFTSGQLDSLYFFKKVVGIEVEPVPYNSTAQATQALLAGEIDLDWSLVQAAKGLSDAGKLIPIGVTAAQRDSHMPALPTVKEQGYDYETGFWFGFYGPKGLPADLANRISGDYAKVFNSKEAADTLDKFGMSPRITGPDGMKKAMLEQEKRYKEAAAAINLTPK